MATLANFPRADGRSYHPALTLYHVESVHSWSAI
jgi:hypothetical protein